MRTLDINQEKEKLEIIRWVATIRDRKVLETLKMLKEDARKIDWWEGVSDDEKKSIALRNLGNQSQEIKDW